MEEDGQEIEQMNGKIEGLREEIAGSEQSLAEVKVFSGDFSTYSLFSYFLQFFLLFFSSHRKR